MEYRQQLLQGYKQMISPLLGYLPWLEANQGQPGSRLYRGEEFTEHSMSFPVYDGTLLRFVKEASRTKLMDKITDMYIRETIFVRRRTSAGLSGLQN